MDIKSNKVTDRSKTTLLQRLQDLPPGPRSQVLSYLGSSRSFLQTAAVCKQWHELVQRNLTAVDARVTNAEQARHLAAFIARLEQLKKARIRLAITGPASKATRDVLASLQQAAQLQQLHISSLQPEVRHVQAVLDASTSRLTSLELALPIIESLHLPPSLENFTWKQPEAITHLSARSVRNAAFPALQHLTALTALDLSDCLCHKPLPALPLQLRKLTVKDTLAQQMDCQAVLQGEHGTTSKLPALEELRVYFSTQPPNTACWLPVLQQLPGLKVLLLLGKHGEVCSQYAALLEAAQGAALAAPASAPRIVLPATLRELYLEYLPCMAALAGLTELEVLQLGPHPLVTTTPLGTAAATPAGAAPLPDRHQQGLLHPEAVVLPLAAAQHPKLRVLRLRGNWGPRQQLMLDDLACLTGLKELSLVGRNCTVCINPARAGAACAASAAAGSSATEGAGELMVPAAAAAAAAAAAGSPRAHVQPQQSASAAIAAWLAAGVQVHLPTRLESLCIDGSNHLEDVVGLSAATLASLGNLTCLQQLALSGVLRGKVHWAALTTLTRLTSLQLGGLQVLPQRPLNGESLDTKTQQKKPLRLAVDAICKLLEKMAAAHRGFESRGCTEPGPMQTLQLMKYADSLLVATTKHAAAGGNFHYGNWAQQVQLMQQRTAAMVMLKPCMMGYSRALEGYNQLSETQCFRMCIILQQQVLRHSKLLLALNQVVARQAAAHAASAPGRTATLSCSSNEPCQQQAQQQDNGAAAVTPPAAAMTTAHGQSVTAAPATHRWLVAPAEATVATSAAATAADVVAPAAGMRFTGEGLQLLEAFKADLRYMMQQRIWLQHAMRVSLMLKLLWLFGQHPEHLLAIASQLQKLLSRFTAASQEAAEAAAQAGDQLTPAAVAAPAAAAAAERAAVLARTHQLMQQASQLVKQALVKNQGLPCRADRGQQGFVKLLSCLPKLQHLSIAPCNAYGRWQPMQLWEQQQGVAEGHGEASQSQQQAAQVHDSQVQHGNCTADYEALNQKQLAEVVVEACAAAAAAGTSGPAQLTYLVFGHGNISDRARLLGLAAGLKQLKQLRQLALVGSSGPMGSLRHVNQAFQDEVAAALPGCKVTSIRTLAPLRG